MRILNVGCGSIRPPEPFINLDNLRTQLPPGTGARVALDQQKNYVEHDLFNDHLPFPQDLFDGVLLAHCLEHFRLQKGVKLLADCRRVLKPGGVLLVSVPDASYFRKVHPEDRNENWPRLFDTTDPKNPIPTFMAAALFFEQHEVVFTEDGLWCCLVQSGFSPESVSRISSDWLLEERTGEGDAFSLMAERLDRVKFSLVMRARKE